MPRRPLLQSLIFALVALLAATALAAPRDTATKKKIDEAINKYFVATDFIRAESTLADAINACGSQCSGPVIAKAWMYVGIVRGSGKNDQKGAKEAFINAIVADPKVQLDDALATSKTKKTFAAAQAAAPVGVGPAPTEEGGEGAAGTMDCSPKVTEVQTRRPIPVSCTTVDGVKKVELRYNSGGESWKSVKMKKKRGAYQATIPCKDLQRKGTLRFYVRARDGEGDTLDGYGTKSHPQKISIVKETDEEPPAFPEKEPPSRCARTEPAGGGECSSSDDCDSGLACVSGTCQKSQSCEESSDCPDGGKCVEGRCEGRKKKKGGPYAETWFGLHFAYDLALVGGTDVCSQDSQQNKGFACFYKDTEEPYRFNPHPKVANKINSGVAPATYRALISLDRMFNENISLGLRAGYAFNGGPPSGKKKDVAFLPYHFEVRASYWIGESPFSQPGFRPYVGVEGGAAQVDAKMPISVGDCAGTPGGPPSKPGATLVQDATYYQACSKGNGVPSMLELDAYKKLGKGFVGLHAGLMYAVSRDGGILLNVNFMQMLPTSGQVIEPSLGYAFGL